MVSGNLTSAPAFATYGWSHNNTTTDTHVPAEQYKLIVSRDGGVVFEEQYTVTQACNNTTVCSVSPNFELANGSYTWVVEASSTIGGTANGVSGPSFVINLPLPDAITKLSPTGHQVIVDGQVRFQWQHDTRASRYWLYVVGDEGFNQWYSTSDICSGSFCTTPVHLMEIGVYTWYVAGWGGALGSWGDPDPHGITFAVGPVLNRITPTAGTTITNAFDGQVQFQWNADGVSTYYGIRITGPNDFEFLHWFLAGAVCSGSVCSIIQPLLVNGSYNWQVAGYSPANGVGNWGFDTPFTLDVPPPVLPGNLNVNPNQGRPTITWNDDFNAGYFQVFIGGDNGNEYLAWHARTPSLCNGVICSLNPDLNLTRGIYNIYVQAWSPGGFSTGGAQGWAGPAILNLNWDAPPAMSGFQVTNANSGHPTFSWTGTLHSTWYQLWVGQLDPTTITHHIGWYLASQLGCDNMGTCWATPDNLDLATGQYTWYVRSWGAGWIQYGWRFCCRMGESLCIQR